jgi:hypothetical protein
MAVITLPTPSMALNAWNMTGWGYPRYKLWNSWMMAESETLDHIVGWVGEVAKAAPGGKLRCLVVNSHGSCGRARLSKPVALDKSNADEFAPLKGKIDHILISACSVIGVKPGEDGFWNDPGVEMSRALARATGARVYASNETQSMDVTYVLLGGHGDIDGFEGYVLCMPPSGQPSWLPDNASLSARIKLF